MPSALPRFLPFEHFMENGPDMWCRVVGRQIKLDGNSLPEAICVFEDAVSGVSRVGIGTDTF
jgi:hypothetical protein